jgi:hypothetical protein
VKVTTVTTVLVSPDESKPVLTPKWHFLVMPALSTYFDVLIIRANDDRGHRGSTHDYVGSPER